MQKINFFKIGVDMTATISKLFIKTNTIMKRTSGYYGDLTRAENNHLWLNYSYRMVIMVMTDIL